MTTASMLRRGLVLLVAFLPAVALAQPQPPPQAPDEDDDPVVATDPDAPIPKLVGRPIDRIQFRGNRKVEDDAIRINLLSKVGATIDANKIRVPT